MIVEGLTTRKVWEDIRPFADAVAVASSAGLDVAALEGFEEKFQFDTVPYLDANVLPLVPHELHCAIDFCQERIRQATQEFEEAKTFAQRRYIMEERIPVAQKFLQRYEGWLGRVPSIQWEPPDVVEIRERGAQRFIRCNLERFYNN